jgi:hypothetical protein
MEAMVWVLNEAPGLPSHAFGTLMGLATHADKFGRAAFPAQATLAGYTRKSARQVRRDLDDLVAAGLIRHGDPRFVAHIPADERPIVWDLAMEKTASEAKPKPQRGGRGRPVADVRPDVDDRSDVHVRSLDETADQTSGRTPTSGRTSMAEGADVGVLLTVLEPKSKSSTRRATSTTTRKKSTPTEHPLFAEFWKAYPRREGKGKAREAFNQAVDNGATPEVIVSAAARFARHCIRVKTERGYMPHPTTWLNQERWEDEYDADPGTEGAPPKPLPPHCGHCDPANRWIELPDGRYDRCPDCHPDNARSHA